MIEIEIPMDPEVDDGDITTVALKSVIEGLAWGYVTMTLTYDSLKIQAFGSSS